jgi:dienelactone hydrolase
VSYRLSKQSRGNIPCLMDQIVTAEQWEMKRLRIKNTWLDLLGTPPVTGLHTSKGNKVSFEVIEEVKESGYRRLDIQYATLDGDAIRAFLLLPNGTAVRGQIHPAILALHPTTPDGREDVATPEGRENRRYGLELVSRGYVVIAPDSISCGSRVFPGAEPFQTASFYQQHPNWTVVGKMLADHFRAVDLLSSLDVVDDQRIGVIGHSLGGYNGWFLAGLDDRIRAVASSCGFSMFTDDPDPNRWGQRDWFSHFPVITSLLQEDYIPFEWHEVAALAAPTPMFMWSGLKDHIFPNWEATVAGMADLEGLYNFLGEKSNFEFWLGLAAHDFPLQARRLAYDFLDLHLKN